VQLHHPLLAHSGGGGQCALCRGDGLLVSVGDQRLGGRPSLLGVIPGDDVQADAEAHLASVGLGERAHAVEALPHLRGRLAPGQVDVGVERADMNLTLSIDLL
jgi:hypothetical protein